MTQQGYALVMAGATKQLVEGPASEVGATFGSTCMWEQATGTQSCCRAPLWPGEEDPNGCKNRLDKKHPMFGRK